jgi:putative isomerase
MKKILIISISVILTINCFCQQSNSGDITKYIQIIREHIYKDYKGMYREPKGALKYHYVTPGSQAYSTQLWDWDSWLSSIALRQIVTEKGIESEKQEAGKYEKGCVLNFLNFYAYGWMPIVVNDDLKDFNDIIPENPFNVNCHKPMLAQQAAFVCKMNNGDAEWLRDKFFNLQSFVDRYINYQKNKATGIYFWINDMAIGVDNDPSTFFRPERSSGNLYLNCLMYKELKAMSYLAKQLNMTGIDTFYEKQAEELKTAIRNLCWDEWTGFYYSVDLNLLPVVQPNGKWQLHSGSPRNYDCLIQRFDTWCGFMAMWADIATPEEAKRMVEEHFKNEKTLNAAYGIRSMSKLEKMYDLRATGNPSNWRGPVWGISNYLVFKALVKYGYQKEARELAEKTILLFGKDYERFGTLHEYYLPDNGEPVLNKDFQDWNYLVLNMIAWYEEKPVIEEF